MKIKISSTNIEKAKKRSSTFTKGYRSITSDGAFYGLLGEEIFLDNFGGQLINNNDYDIWLPPLNKIDIKTKRINGEPKPDYECNVAAYQCDKDVDHYVFFRIKNDLSYAYLLGVISKEEFRKTAVFIAKGTRDKQYVASADSYNVKASSLHDLHKLLLL